MGKSIKSIANRHQKETGHRVDVSPDHAQCLECPWGIPFKVQYKAPVAGAPVRIYSVEEVAESLEKVLESQVILSVTEGKDAP